MKRWGALLLALVLLAGCAAPTAAELSETRYRIVYDAADGAAASDGASDSRDGAASEGTPATEDGAQTRALPGQADSSAAPDEDPEKSGEADREAAGGVIGNKNSRVYHLPSCGSLPKEENRVLFGSAAEAEAAGYRPCRRCQPE